MTGAKLTGAERGRFAAVADVLVPGADGMPAASAVGISADLLDRVLAARPDLLAPLQRALAEPIGDPAAHLGRLAQSDRRAAHAVELAVVGGYYLHPEVRERIGYPGQVARPVNALDHPEYLAEGLLDRVLERGLTFREAAQSPVRP